jgi:predicted alpha-1,2-mannosidase
MVEFSPDTTPGATAFGGGYSYGDSVIRDFSFKHMSGPGCSAYQDIPVTPTTVRPAASPAQPGTIRLDAKYDLPFKHADEHASAGSYSVQAGGIGSDLTATTRAGIARFTYPQGSTPGLLVNAAGSVMGTTDASVHIDPARREITGSAVSGHFCSQPNAYKLYFAARFDTPFRSYATWKRDLLIPGSTDASDSLDDQGASAQAGAYVEFAAPKVVARVGLSFVSVGAARANLDGEAGAPSFDQLRAEARATWNRALDRIRVSGGRRRDLRLFYTMLYRALLHPSTFSDLDGRYRGFDGQVHQLRAGHVQYADYSGWDTYRSQMQLVAMLFPRRAADMAQSLVNDARESGWLPKWSQANGHTQVMTGDPADLLLADAWAFGARGFDLHGALAAALKGATLPGAGDYIERPALADYLRLGFVPYEQNTDSSGATVTSDKVWGASATTLEYAVADFGVARLAAAACDSANAAIFMTRASNWRNVIDEGYAKPRNQDGSFRQQAPTAQDGFVEGNGAQYTWFVPHDPAQLFAVLGGHEQAAARLEDFFQQINAGPDAPYAFLGNEPTLGTPWLFNWLGRPWRTQEIVRRALLELYGDKPGGFPGNDDLGSMSSWWVFGALGFYPAIPGDDVLVLGSPLFRHALLRLGGRTLQIDAPHAATDRPYVNGLRLNGRIRRASWIRFSRLLARNTRLRFDLRAAPNRSWAARSAPPSPGSGPVPRCTLGAR